MTHVIAAKVVLQFLWLLVHLRLLCQLCLLEPAADAEEHVRCMQLESPCASPTNAAILTNRYAMLKSERRCVAIEMSVKTSVKILPNLNFHTSCRWR